MRRGIIALGLAALVTGALVSFVPIFPVASGSRTVGSDQVAYFQVHSLLIDEYYQVPWTSSSPTTVWVEDCGGTMPTSSGLTPCPGERLLTQQTGRSGTLSFSAPNGDWILEGTNGTNASVSLRTTNGEVGVFTLAVGALLLVVGLISASSAKASGPTPGTKGKKSEEPAKVESGSAAPAVQEASPSPGPESSGGTSPSDQAGAASPATGATADDDDRPSDETR